MKTLLVTGLLTSLISGVASADIDIVDVWDWNDGVSTILGSYGNLSYALNVLDPLGGGSNVLEINEDPLSGTPQAFVAWITGLTDGDEITGSFWGLGDGVANAKTRIWGHYTTAGGDIDAYDGSAGGNSTYSGADWTFLEKTWTFNGDGGNHGGLVIEARIYGYSGGSSSSCLIDLTPKLVSLASRVRLLIQ